MLELSTVYNGNTIREYAIAGAIAFVVTAVLAITKRLVRRRLRKLVDTTETRLDDLLLHLLNKTKLFTSVAVGVLIGSRGLNMTAGLYSLIHGLVFIFILLQVGIWATAAIGFTVENYRTRKTEEDDLSSIGAAGLLGAVGKIVCWSVVLLLILDNLGVNITTLVAGLGIGGIAVALAVQSTLKDLFASVSIMLDKPFEVGDLIKVGADEGTVEYIGIKTSRVRAPSGEELVFSNSDLLSSRIRNFKRLKDRRAILTIGAPYNTPADKTEAIPGMLKDIIQGQEHTRFERAFFTQIGQSALMFEAIYYMTDDDYLVFLGTQQAINLEILRQFEQNGISLAYPTQTVRVEKNAL